MYEANAIMFIAIEHIRWPLGFHQALQLQDEYFKVGVGILVLLQYFSRSLKKRKLGVLKYVGKKSKEIFSTSQVY